MAHRAPIRVLFVCTGNSARSQIAEALLNQRGGGRFHAESAGSHPAPEVNPGALQVMRTLGLAWSGRGPRSIDEVMGQPWDLVITVCDNAKESCPVFPGAPAVAHWGMPDPAGVTDPVLRAKAFEAAVVELERRIAGLLGGLEG